MTAVPEVFSNAVIRKGQEYVLDGRVSRSADTTWKVRGSRPTPYAVNTDARVEPDGSLTWAFATCSCRHGRNTPRPSCSHFAAVVLTVLAERAGVLDEILPPAD